MTPASTARRAENSVETREAAPAINPGKPANPFLEALTHHSAGRAAAAVPLYRSVLMDNPNHTEANHFLGMILFQHGQAALACEHLARASAAQDATPEMHNNYGVALHAEGRVEDAATAFTNALTARPRYAEAYNNLGMVFKDRGFVKEAREAFERAVTLKPDYAVAAENLAALG